LWKSVVSKAAKPTQQYSYHLKNCSSALNTQSQLASKAQPESECENVNKGKIFQSAVEKLGWTLTVKPDFRRRDCTLYYEDNLAIEAKKGNRTVQVTAEGDIRIYGKRTNIRTWLTSYFVYKGGKPSGKLTYYLRTHGRWENNNWFEFTVFKKGKSIDYDSNVEYTILEAARHLLDLLEELDEIEHPLDEVTVSPI
jgi:hypothetical protein